MKVFENIVQGFVEVLGYIGLEFAFYAAAAAYVVGCFVVFDALRITDSNTQICIGIAPFLAVAAWAVWRGKIKVK